MSKVGLLYKTILDLESSVLSVKQVMGDVRTLKTDIGEIHLEMDLHQEELNKVINASDLSSLSTLLSGILKIQALGVLRAFKLGDYTSIKGKIFKLESDRETISFVESDCPLGGSSSSGVDGKVLQSEAVNSLILESAFNHSKKLTRSPPGVNNSRKRTSFELIVHSLLFLC
ncbi:hypothetical protein CHUAL_004425 [Chamberlinius hualienensis]